MKILFFVLFIFIWADINLARETECLDRNGQEYSSGQEIYLDNNWYICKNGIWEKIEDSTQSDRESPNSGNNSQD